jgi:hypothetical protein
VLVPPAAGSEPARYLRHVLEANLTHVTNYVRAVSVVRYAVQTVEDNQASIAGRTKLKYLGS